jgi:hypothetical protein
MAVAITALATATMAAVTLWAPQASASNPQAGRVPVPDGRYGAVDLRGNMVMFTVRNRRIFNPRVVIEMTCRASDGVTSVSGFGPTSSNDARSSPIPAGGNGSIAWVEEFDSSLLADAEVTVNYTFRRGRVALASVNVISRDPESTCDGSANFRLNDRRFTPPFPDTCVPPAWWPRMCSDLGLN